MAIIHSVSLNVCCVLKKVQMKIIQSYRVTVINRTGFPILKAMQCMWPNMQNEKFKSKSINLEALSSCELSGNIANLYVCIYKDGTAHC